MASIDRRNHATACSQLPRWFFARPTISHPGVSRRIARTEAQGLGNVSLGFFGATDKNLAKSDKGMGAGKISIQRQRMFTFGDALAARLVNISTSPNNIWPRAWSGTDDKALVNFASAAAKAAVGSVTKEIAPVDASARRRSNERVDIVGIGGERAIEKAARLRHIVRGQTLVEPSQTLKIEVHRVGVRRLFGASRLGGDELGVERARQTRDDFVLHVEEIGERLVEPLGPEMIARFGVDELHVDAHAVAAALNAALEDIADVQLAADLSSRRPACLCR